MPAKFYWFYLEPYVYVTIKGTDLLLYNCLTGKYISYTGKPHLTQFLLELNRKENLYALKVSAAFLKEKDLEAFTADVSEHFMGDLIDLSVSPKKPFLLPPHFDIQKTVTPRQRRTFRNVARDSIFSLSQLTLFVNNRCNSNCTACNSAGKQFLWCTREKEDNERNPLSPPASDRILGPAKIKEILDQVKGCPIKTIDIIGGDLTQYPHLTQLVDLLRPGSFNVNYYFHLSHLKNGSFDAVRAGDPQAKVTLLIDFSTLSIPGDVTYLKQLQPDRFIFLIQRDDEIPTLEGVLQNLKTENISVQPYFNGHNLDFFKANVFSDHQSLTETILDIGAINARKTHNPLSYGKMFIRSDQKIYSHLNGAALGTMGEISMGTAVISELSEQGNWLRARRDVAPCCDCLLNSICPPLSNFEIASGINNSCNIRKENSTGQ